MRLERTFFIQVYENGRQYPIIKMHEGRLSMLSELANEHMSTCEGVAKELDNIGKVVRGDSKSYTLSTSDWCIVNITQLTSTITNGFDEFDPITIETGLLIELLNDWARFLNVYESGKIPGLAKVVI